MTQSHGILEMSAFDPAQAGALAPDVAELVARRARSLGGASPLFYREPIHVVRASGVWLYDAHGTPYLDVYNNVPSVGHSHPHVVEAMCRQAAVLNTHTRYLYDSICTYAERLLASFPADLANVVFTCTGSESTDLALRIARHFTGATGVVVTENAYHGNTTAASEISPSSGPGVPLGAQVRTVPAPDRYRRPGEGLGRRFAADVAAAIEALARHGLRCAALVVDTVFSSDGVFTEPRGFLAEAVDAVRDAGGLFIADEVQPGFARTGGAMWGFQRHGVLPDLVVLGKPMGNGWPMAGVVARSEILADFARRAGYFNTFGGNPVAAATGLAVLEVLERERLADNARDVGAYFRHGLRTLAEAFPLIGDVRGDGLFIGVELSEDGRPERPATHAARAVVEGLRQRRILIGTAGRHGNVLKLRPPLCFSREHADAVIDGMRAVLAAL